MSLMKPFEIHCPYCGQLIEITIDGSAGSQKYIEDCSVCCRPVNLNVTLDENGERRVRATSEDEE